MEQGALCARRQRSGNAGLQDAVTLRHTQGACVQAGQVVGMRCHPDQFAQSAWWQLSVAVERHNITRACRDAGRLRQLQEGTPRPGRQCRDQPFKFAPFALPANPALLAGTELARAMQHDKTRRHSGLRRITLIERADRGAGVDEQRRIRCQLLRVCVGPVAEQRKLCLRFGVCEVVQFQPARQFAQGRQAREDCRDHHHDAVRSRDAVGQCQAWQVLRQDRLANQPVHHGHHGF